MFDVKEFKSDVTDTLKAANFTSRVMAGYQNLTFVSINLTLERIYFRPFLIFDNATHVRINFPKRKKNLCFMVEEVVYIHIFLKIEWKSVNLSNLALESRKKNHIYKPKLSRL